jgi:UPF0042 nucleotide-binding protein
MLRVISFAYRRGPPPADAAVFDCRGLRNPHVLPSLRELDGRAPEVQAFVKADVALPGLLETAELFVKQGADVIAFGCFGGRHRSVAVAEMFAAPMRVGRDLVQVEHWALDAPPVS